MPSPCEPGPSAAALAPPAPVRGLWYERRGCPRSLLLKDVAGPAGGSVPSSAAAPALRIETYRAAPDAKKKRRRCSKGKSKQADWEPWEEDEEMVLKHIRDCRCACNHLGYGNYLDLANDRDWTKVTSAPGVPPAPRRPSYGACAAPLKAKTPPDASSLHSPDLDDASDKGASQRTWCVACLLVLLLALTGLGVIIPLTARLRHTSHTDHLAAVRRMLLDHPLVDGHNDLAWNLRSFLHNRLSRFNLSADLRQVAPWSSSAWSHTDLPRLRKGLVGAQFWAAYVPCDSQYKDAVQLTLEQISVIRRLVDSYADLQFVTTAAGVEQAHAVGRIASLLSVEGGHSLGASLGVLRAMYQLGVRCLTLTHTCHTPWADSSSGSAEDSNTKGQGLTDFGKVVVRELNRLGVVVDLSHAAPATVQAVLNVSRSPVIFSHSAAAALCDNPRNVPDSVLTQLAQNGGVVMLSFYNDFLTCSPAARMEDVMRHLTHIRDVAGDDHVGLGAGYDGINRTPLGLEDVSRYPFLLAELHRSRGWTMEQLQKLAGRNILRVLRGVEKVKEEMRLLAIEPYEDVVPPAELEGKDAAGCLGR
ncbi:dipeptidase 1-like [Schistocerca americana]|uniref:dipeptidase 1-like n=1 Tax=Schistocerca americana TaxID=7009 RepID=UPI001F4F768B|nr:dipeptidase 1-like [Schistocerca americana]XP_049940906.1 dipeptidase 1-like [Schistocerca serialis cubense]